MSSVDLEESRTRQAENWWDEDGCGKSSSVGIFVESDGSMDGILE